MDLITTNNSTDDICLICHENYENKKEYTLECNHKYHTDCIMKWFRMGNKNCPLCNDQGNNINFNMYGRITKLSQLRQLTRRKDCPPVIKTAVNKLRKKENDFKTYKTYFKNFVNNNKDIIKQYQQNLKKRRYYKSSIRKIQRAICNIANIFPIYVIKK